MRLRLFCAILASLTLAGCGYSDPTPAAPVAGTGGGDPCGTPTDDFNAGSDKTPVTLPDGLKYVDLTPPGTGPEVQGGSEVSMEYTGWLSDGTKFDSSRDRNNDPFKLTIGQGQVIKGWDEGIPGMRRCQKRRLIIPPELGYGKDGSPPTIPANSTLIFVVELVSLQAPASPSPTAASSPGSSP